MIHGDPVAQKTLESLPRSWQKRLSPAQAGEAVAQGIEKRVARIVAPRRWTALSALREIINPILDNYMIQDQDIQALVRELDAREGQEQPLTA